MRNVDTSKPTAFPLSSLAVRLARATGAVLCVTATTPSIPAAAAREATAGTSQDRIVVFARVHVARAALYEEFQNRLGHTHDAPGKEEVRAWFEERFAALLEEHGMTEEEHRRLTFLVSTDPERRTAFEAALAEVRGGGD